MLFQREYTLITRIIDQFDASGFNQIKEKEKTSDNNKKDGRKKQPTKCCVCPRILQCFFRNNRNERALKPATPASREGGQSSPLKRNQVGSSSNSSDQAPMTSSGAQLVTYNSESPQEI